MTPNKLSGTRSGGKGNADGPTGGEDRAVGRDCRDSGRLYATAQDGAGFGAAGADRAGLRGGSEQQGAVAAREEVTPQTVGQHGLDGLLDEPRPGVPRKIDDSKVESVIVQTLESQPLYATHWRQLGAAQRLLDLERRTHLARLRAAAAPP